MTTLSTYRIMSRRSTHRWLGPDRAAQFSPFAALTGLDAALRETARLTDQRITLDEYEQAALDETLQTVRDALTKKEHPTVEVCYFVPDTRKAGGAYCTVTGVVKKMAEFEGLLIMADGTEVPMGRSRFWNYTDNGTEGSKTTQLFQKH